MELVDVSGRSRPSDKGDWGGHPDPEIKGGGRRSPKKLHFGRKVRGARAPRAHPLDPLLDGKAYLHFFMRTVYLCCQ